MPISTNSATRLQSPTCVQAAIFYRAVSAWIQLTGNGAPLRPDRRYRYYPGTSQSQPGG
jgi:hypothetical protein